MKWIMMTSLLLMSAGLLASDYEQDYPLATEYDSEQTDTDLVAPPEVVNDLVAVCKDWALSDAVSDAELPAYVLDCVNQELTSQGYQALAQLGR